jgi:hypothetical protein
MSEELTDRVIMLKQLLLEKDLEIARLNSLIDSYVKKPIKVIEPIVQVKKSLDNVKYPKENELKIIDVLKVKLLMHVILINRPCKVVDIRRSANSKGKGPFKLSITGIDVLTQIKYNEVLMSSKTMFEFVPIKEMIEIVEHDVKSETYKCVFNGIIKEVIFDCCDQETHNKLNLINDEGKIIIGNFIRAPVRISDVIFESYSSFECLGVK